MIHIPQQIIGWHGHSEATIIEQDGTNIVLDLQNWIDERGYGEWKDGIKIKKEFPKYFLIYINLDWNKEIQTNVCDDMILGKGIVKGNKLYGVLLTNNLFLMKEVRISFPHKTKQIQQKDRSILIEPDEYDEEELKGIVQQIKCN